MDILKKLTNGKWLKSKITNHQVRAGHELAASVMSKGLKQLQGKLW